MEAIFSPFEFVQMGLLPPTPEVVGKMIGELLVICLIPAIGVWRTEKALRNEGTNSKCALSLLSLFLTWIIGATWVRVSRFFFEEQVVMAGLGVVAILGFLVATISAVMGLIARRRATPRPRGFWMAATSLLLIGFFLSTIYATQVARQSRRLAADRASSNNERGRLQTFEDLNFTYAAPAKWTSVIPSQVNEEASVAFVRTDPVCFFIVIAERFEEPIDSAWLASISEANLKGIGAAVRVSEHEACAIGGMAGYRFATELTLEGAPFIYQHGAVAKNGFAYQLIAWGAAEYGRSELADRFDDLVLGFRLIDPDASCRKPVEPEPPYESELYGFRVEVPEGLASLDDPSQLREEAEFAAESATGESFLVVMAAVIGDQAAELDHVGHSMLQELGWAPGEEGVIEVDRGKLDAPNRGEYVEYLRRESDGAGAEGLYRLRVIYSDGGVYLITGYSADAGEEGQADTQRLMSSFRLPVNPPTLDRIASASKYRRERQAFIVGRLGVAEYEAGLLERAVGHCELAARCEPTHATLVENLANIGSELLGPDGALERLERVVDVSSARRDVRLVHARLLAQTSRSEEAIPALAAIPGPLSDDDLLTLCNLAVDSERYDEALGALDVALTARGSVTLRRWRGVMASRAGRHAEAVKRLGELVSKHPEDADLCVALAEAHESAEQPGLGVVVCEQFATRKGGNASVLAVMGRLQLEAEDYRGAKATLTKTLDLDPRDESSRQLLKYVSGLLGRGENQRVRDPLDPVEVPPEITERLAEGPGVDAAQALAEKTGSAYLSRVVSYAYRRGETRRVTERRRLCVASQRGVEKHSTITVGFDPLVERVFVNRLVVTDASGTAVAEADVEDFYVLDANDSGYDSYDQRLVAPVPGLKPGRLVEFTFTRESLGSADDFGYEHEYLSATDPVLLAAVSVVGSVDTLDARHSQALRTEAEDNALVWIAERPERIAYEPFQPGIDAYAPWVRLADRGRDWATLGDEYLDRLAEVLTEDDMTQQWGKELVAGLADKRSIIRQLSQAVQEELTYQAQEFGVRGVIPNRVARIRRASSGDCKDHAVLLYHLLRTAGVESHLALVSTEDLVEEGLPALDQFDHMVVAVPNQDSTEGGWELVDPTNKYADPIIAGAMAAESRTALVLQPDESRLVRVSPLDADSGKIRCDRVVRVEPNGLGATLQIVETVRLAPVAAMPIRASLRGGNAAEQRETLWRFIGEGSIGSLKRASVKGLEDLHEPLELRCEYDLEKAWDAMPSNPGKFVGELPTHWAGLYFSADAVEDRKTPFRLKSPLEYRGLTRLQAPDGFQSGGADGVRSSGDEKAFRWRIEGRIERDGDLLFAARLTRKTGTFPADEYDRFRKAITGSVRALRGPAMIRAADPP